MENFKNPLEKPEGYFIDKILRKFINSVVDEAERMKREDSRIKRLGFSLPEISETRSGFECQMIIIPKYDHQPIQPLQGEEEEKK